LLTGSSTLSIVLDRMAANVADQMLSGLSSLRLYELFFRLAATGGDSSSGSLLADALFYDFCCSEMPRQGKLPLVIAERSLTCAWPGGRELTAGMDLLPGSRVKAFRFSFRRDYRIRPWGETPVEITFFYVSSMGGGLKIVCM